MVDLDMLSALPDRTDLDFERVRHTEETHEPNFFKAKWVLSDRIISLKTKHIFMRPINMINLNR